MSLTVGATVQRLDDGQRGTVELVDGERRVVYEDRGERVIAPKKETWVPVEDPPKKLRATEIIEVALYADRALQSIDQHIPLRLWQKPSINDGVHDQGLFDVITAYLQKRV
jgi:hypothetical protein